MTVASTTTKVSYTGDGVTVAFPVTFPFFDSDELEVIERTIATGVEVVRMLTTDYAVAGGGGSTGTVTAVTAPGNTISWVIRRNTKRTQLIDYIANDPFPAETHENGLDRGAMRDQEQDEEFDRSMRVPKTDAAINDMPNSVDRASKFLAFDTSGDPIASTGPTGSSTIPVSAFIETLLDDADKEIARTTLDAQEDVITTRGDLVRGGATAAAERLAVGTAGQVVGSDGTDVTWGAPALPRSYLAGMVLGNTGGDPAHDITVTGGVCRSSDNLVDITVPASTLSKQIDASWAAGNNAGGLSSSLTLSADTWYHVHAIVVSGAADVGFDTSITADNLATDHSATAYRRLGSVLTDGSSNILGFVQNVDHFQWKTSKLDATITDMAFDTAALAALSVPIDLSVVALLNVGIHGTGNGKGIYFSDPAVNDESPKNNSNPGLTMGGAINSGSLVDLNSDVVVRTNSSAQVRYRNNDVTADMDMEIATLGWVDSRGRGA